jgi:lauroyl/myristoyl acyltransferase
MRFAKRADIRTLTSLCGGFVVTALLPRRIDHWAVPRTLASSRIIREPWIRDIESRMRLALGPFLPAADFHRLAREYCRTLRENQWLRWRALHRATVPVGTAVDGADHVEAALTAGRGVILWGMSFCDTLVVKIALHRAGIRLVQLSTANHGAAAPPTWLGLRAVSPLHCAAENRFLAERVVMPADGSLGYMRQLIDRLERNHCVYIVGDRLATRENISAPLLGREAQFAPGAPGLAWKVGSRLLPVHVIREAPLRYRAVIDRAIDVDNSLARNAFIEDAVRRFAERLEQRVLESPSGWAWYSQIVAEWIAERAAQ